MAGLIRVGLVVALALTVSACDRTRAPRLLPDSGKIGPDEFAIVPNKPLQEPLSYAELPAPTPGYTNISDPTPNADAIAALGGRADGVAANDLLAHASRYGTDPNIRESLEEEDIAYRRRFRGRILDRLVGRNTYLQAYDRQRLDSYAELERLRRLGVITPTAPPKGVSQ